MKIFFDWSGQPIKLSDKPIWWKKNVFGFIHKKFVNKCRECFKFLDWEIWFVYKDNKIIW